MWELPPTVPPPAVLDVLAVLVCSGGGGLFNGSGLARGPGIVLRIVLCIAAVVL